MGKTLKVKFQFQQGTETGKRVISKRDPKEEDRKLISQTIDKIGKGDVKFSLDEQDMRFEEPAEEEAELPPPPDVDGLFNEPSDEALTAEALKAAVKVVTTQIVPSFTGGVTSTVTAPNGVHFTVDQEIAMRGLTEFINANKVDKPVRKLNGPAGTGKTFLIKYIIENCGIATSRIGLATPTHKASKVLSAATGLDVHTIHSDLGLRLNFDDAKFDIKNPPFDPKSPPKIGNYDLYILDEASMLITGHRLLLEALARKSNTRIIYCGDGFQLPPPREYFSSAFKGCNGWELTEVIRQGVGNPLSDLLLELRADIKNHTTHTMEFLNKHPEEWNSDNSKGYKLVRDNEEFSALLRTAYTSEKYYHDVSAFKTLAYTNDAVAVLNLVIRDATIGNSAPLCLHDLLTSYINLVDKKFLKPIITNSEDYIIDGINDYVKDDYGKGFFVRLQAVYGGEKVQPLFILDNSSIASKKYVFDKCYSFMQRIEQTPVQHRSKVWQEYYAYRDGALIMKNIRVRNPNYHQPFSEQPFYVPRTIDYGFALTVHKSQGSTYDETFVNMYDIVYDQTNRVRDNIDNVNRLLYVAFSRPKNKLYIKI
jgi:exodeoxyribonuclease-5